METQDSSEQAITIGASVQATNGFIGSVTAIVTDPQTNEVSELIVENENGDKEFTIPADLISHQTGSRLVHLKVSRDDLLKKGADMQIDTETGNTGYHNPPRPE